MGESAAVRSELHANRGGSDHHAGTAPANQRLRQAPTTFHIILAVWGSSAELLFQ